MNDELKIEDIKAMIKEREAHNREIASELDIKGKDEDYLVIGDFLKGDIRSYEIGFGIIKNGEKEVKAVKSYEVNEDDNLAVFIYNCNLDIENMLNREVILRDRRNQYIWIGRVREIPKDSFEFSNHEKGNLYICDRVINKDTIKNANNAAIAVLKGNDRIFSVLSIRGNNNLVVNKKEKIEKPLTFEVNKPLTFEVNKPLNFEMDKKEEKDNLREYNLDQKSLVEEKPITINENSFVSTELKHYIKDSGEKLIDKIIREVITKPGIEIKNVKKEDISLDGYARIAILKDRIVVSVNQKAEVETIISFEKETLSLEKVLAFVMNL